MELGSGQAGIVVMAERLEVSPDEVQTQARRNDVLR